MKRNAPDLTIVKDAYRSSYSYSCSSVSKIGDVFRVNGIPRPNLNQYLPDDEVQAKIGVIAKNAAYYACQEGIKCVSGGALVERIVSKSFRDYSEPKDYKGKIKSLEATVGKLEKEISDIRKLHEQAEICKRAVDLESRNARPLGSYVNKKPEEVIRIFMAKEFMGTHFLDDLIVPGVGYRKNPGRRYDV